MAIQTHNISTISHTAYTSSGDSAVTFMSLCNHSGGPVTIDLHVVPSGDGVATSNRLISQLVIAADDTYILYQGSEKLILADSDTIVVAVLIGDINKITTIVSYVGV